MASKKRNGFVAILLVGLMTAAAAMSACGGSGPGGSLPIAEARSDNARILEPQVTDADLAELVQGNSTFAFVLYRLLSDSDENLFFSPYSISAALAMTYAGARTETEQEMANALSFLLPQERLHPGFNALDLALTEKIELRENQTGDTFQLNIANTIWGEQTYAFLPEFLDTLAENYGAGLQLVDFINNFEAARETINAWVSDQTEERIPELLEKGTVKPSTRIALTNAIFFNACWLRPFDPAETRDGTFHLLDGSEVQTSMMHRGERSGYGEVDGVEIVPLRYEDFHYGMYAILPPEGEFETFESSIDAEQIEALIDSVGDFRVDLTMPKFEFDSSFDLPETLKELGMVSAFEPFVADLSGMDGTQDLFISQIVHKAFVAVDEEGTEAAAATGVLGEVTSSPGHAEVALNRPFLFLIRHEDTGTILFLGRVMDPTA
ncbi:MAG: serpin family protein [Chloroflexi bacterium]|nr:serpin family protein [Chloroflexota bacterium]